MRYTWNYWRCTTDLLLSRSAAEEPPSVVLSEDEDVSDDGGVGVGLRCRAFRRRRARKGCFSVHEYFIVSFRKPSSRTV